MSRTARGLPAPEGTAAATVLGQTTPHLRPRRSHGTAPGHSPTSAPRRTRPAGGRKAEAQARGVKLTALAFHVKALARALRDFPRFNASLTPDGKTLILKDYVHIGVAVDTAHGLMVPVIRDAQDRNVWQLASEIRRLADAARSGKAKSEELSGSTLTLTSLGPLGGIATTPVINRPEVAIIGPNRVIERPVFRGKEIVAAKLMNLSISCDHRVVDGWDAASYVQAVRKLLENPALLFVD